jgi:hypothetical protein
MEGKRTLNCGVDICFAPILAIRSPRAAFQRGQSGIDYAALSLAPRLTKAPIKKP